MQKKGQRIIDELEPEKLQRTQEKLSPIVAAFFSPESAGQTVTRATGRVEEGYRKGRGRLREQIQDPFTPWRQDLKTSRVKK